jgi:threonine/homoserine/homoserine lactone efflux protein
MTWTSFVLFVGVYAATAALPGPAVVALVTRGIANGFWPTLPFLLGLCIADGILLTLTAAGLAVVAQAMGEAFFLVKLAGAAYLIWLGYKFWVTPITDIAPAQPNSRSSLLGGFALGLGNPKALALWVALVPAVVDFTNMNVMSYLEMLIVGPFLIGPAIGLAYILAADRVRRFIVTARARRRVNQVAGTALIGAGVTVAVT